MRQKLQKLSAIVLACLLLSGCTGTDKTVSGTPQEDSSSISASAAAPEDIIKPTLKVTQLDDGLSAIRFEGNSGFDDFLSQGGAASDSEVAGFLTSLVKENISLGDLLFGCSTISVPSTVEGNLFGRNFDWEPCNAMIVQSAPESGYKSISTVNTDFITTSGVDISQLPVLVVTLLFAGFAWLAAGKIKCAQLTSLISE